MAIVLLISYAGGLWFSLKSHRDLFNPPDEQEHEQDRGLDREALGHPARDRRPRGRADVGDPRRLDRRDRRVVGLSEFFIGAVIVAIVGNAAEHWVAVYVAAKDKMDLAINIAIGSAAQVALFVGPVLVLLSFFFGPHRWRSCSTASSSAPFCWP